MAVGLAGLWPSSAQAQATDCIVANNDTGNFIGITSQGGGFGNPANVEAFLVENGVEGAERVSKVDGFPESGGSSCLDGEPPNVVNAQSTDTFMGVWKSVGNPPVPICALAVHAGGGQDVAVYVYDTPRTEGGWTTENNLGPQNQQQDISNIQFFTCDDIPPVEQTVKIIKETRDANSNQLVDLNQNFIVRINGTQVDTLNTSNTGETGVAMTPMLARAPGNYEVSEDTDNLPNNIDPQEPVCLDAETNSNVGNPFDLEQGQDVECTIVNLIKPIEGAEFRVAKTLNAANGDAITDREFTYDYTNGDPDEPLTILSNGVPSDPIGIVNINLPVEISERSQPNIVTTAIVCTEQQGVKSFSSPNPASGTVVIGPDRIADGDLWTCSFTNVVEPDGRVIVEKKTIGGDDNFNFMISGITFDGASFNLSNGESRDFELVAGTYLIEEKNLPTDWTLQNINCGGEGSRDGNKVTIDLDAGETIRCTFTNFKEGDDPMEDVVKVFINRRVNNLLTNGPDRTRIIRRLDEQRPLHKPMKYAGEEGEAGTATNSIASTLPGIGSNSSIIGKSRSGGAFSGVAGSDLLEHDITPSSSHLGHGFAGSGSGSSSGGYASAPLPFGLSGDVSNGQPVGKFAMSLSQMRNSAQAKDAEKIANAKAYSEALGLGGDPYGVNYGAIPMGLTPNRLDIWAEGHYNHYDDSTGGINRDGDFGILYVGSDYALNDWLLVGALVQFDWTDEDVRQNDLVGGVDGWGWMVGPYMGAALSDHLYFSARAAWGQSENDINLTDNAAGFRKGSFDTDRWLATAELTGNWYHGPWRFTPSVELAYGSEDQEAFRNSLGQRIGSNDATVGQLSFGPEIGYRHVMPDGTIVEPLVSLEGIWNFDDGGLRLADGTPVGDDGLSGKVEGGVLVQMPSGVSWRAVGDYYGIGDGDFDAYGGQVWLSIPLN